MKNRLIVVLIIFGFFFLFNVQKTEAHSGAPQFYLGPYAASSVVCSQSYTFNVSGHENTTIWITQTRDSLLTYDGPLFVPISPYSSKCSQDEGTYVNNIYHYTNNQKGEFIGSTTFTIQPNGSVSWLPTSGTCEQDTFKLNVTNYSTIWLTQYRTVDGAISLQYNGSFAVPWSGTVACNDAGFYESNTYVLRSDGSKGPLIGTATVDVKPKSVPIITLSFRLSGTIFYDQDGDGWHDVDEDKWISSGTYGCKNEIPVPGVKVKISYPQVPGGIESVEYPLNICGNQPSGKYAGNGVYFETDPLPENTTVTATVVVPSGWKSTWPDPITHKVISENFLDFALAKITPVGTPTYYKGPVAVSSVTCGDTYTFDVTNYSGTNIWLNQAKNGTITYDGILKVPTSPYTSICNKDEGNYTSTAYTLTSTNTRGSLIGSTTFTITTSTPTPTPTVIPTISVSLDPSSPTPQNIIAGSTGVEVVKFKFSSNEANTKLLSIVVKRGTGNVCGYVNIKLYDNFGNPLGSAIKSAADDCELKFSNINITIPKGESKVLTLKLDVQASVPSGTTFSYQIFGADAILENTFTGAKIVGLPVTGNLMTVIQALSPVGPVWSFIPNNGTLVAGKDSWTFNLTNAKPGDTLSVNAWKNGVFAGKFAVCQVPTLSPAHSSCTKSGTPGENDVGAWEEEVLINNVSVAPRGAVKITVVAPTTPALTISLSPFSPLSKTLFFGQKDVEVARFRFSAFGEGFFIEKLRLSTTNAKNIDFVQLDYRNKVGTPISTGGVFNVDSMIDFSFSPTVGGDLRPYIPRDSNTDIIVKVNLKTKAEGAESGISFQIYVAPVGFRALAENSGDVITDIGFSEIAGNKMTVIEQPTTADKISVSLDPNTPSPQNIIVGANNVEMTRLLFTTAPNTTTDIEELWIGGVGNAKNISKISIFEGSNLLGSAKVTTTPEGTGEAIVVRITFLNKIRIQPNSTRILSLHADIPTTAQVGATLALGLQSGTATDLSSGEKIPIKNGSTVGSKMTLIASPTITFPTPLPSFPLTPPEFCPDISITLRLGARNEQVRNIQEFLAQDTSIYPEGLITGYFGPLTREAIKSFQAKHGIVSFGNEFTTGYGLVGPKTRAKILEVCEQSVSPQSQGIEVPQTAELKKGSPFEQTASFILQFFRR